MKIFICIPCLDSIDTEFAQSLFALNRIGDTSVHFQASSLVYDSRNKLAQEAIDYEADYVLWLDSDMTFQSDLLIDLLNDMKELKADIVTALFFARRPNFEPCMWTKIRLGIDGNNENVRLVDIPEEPFEIDGCGMAATLVKTEVLKRVLQEDHQLFAPIIGYGEDLSFCIRARRKGFTIYCDPKIEVGHMARTVVTKDTYETWRKRVNNGNT